MTSVVRSACWAIAALAVPLIAGCSGGSTPSPAAPAVSAVPVSQPGLATVTGKAPRGAVVALEPAGGVTAPTPSEAVVMDQRGQQFIPDLLLARAGQPVEFRNGEGIVHNVYVTRAAGGSVELNVSTDPGQTQTHTFTQPGLYEVSCDIHPSMRASLVVVNTPHSAISGDFGSYLIMNVPPGQVQAGDDVRQRVQRARRRGDGHSRHPRRTFRRTPMTDGSHLM